MKLRTRLFLAVGSLFIIFFILAYVIEIFLMDNNLKKSEMELHGELQKVHEEKRKHLEDFLGIVIADIQAEVDSLLYRISKYSYLKEGFAPTSSNREDKTWFAASELILRYNWINYLQNTIDGQVVSQIIPQLSDLHPIDYFPINSDLYWVFVKEGYGRKPYLAINISMLDIAKFAAPMDFNPSKYSELFLFFDVQQLRNFPIPERIQHRTAVSHSDLFLENILIKKLEKAKKYALNIEWPISQQRLMNWIQEKYQKKMMRVDPHEMLEQTRRKSQKAVSSLIEKEFIHIFNEELATDDSVVLIWVLNALLGTDLFGDSPLSPTAPIGISTVLPWKSNGSALLRNEVFSEKKIFQDEKYVQQQSHETDVTASVALILFPSKQQIFLGNTLVMQSGGKKGYLTLGVNIDDFIQRLSLAANEIAILVHNNQVITVFNEQGEKDKNSIFKHLPLSQMKGKTGLVTVGGTPYYYLHLYPYKDADLHFYTLRTKKQAFAFVDFLRHTLSRAVMHISWGMRLVALVAVIVGLIFLEFIARRITRPIAKLAKASISVSEGHYDKIELAEVPQKRKDEIGILVQSFDQMVKGLQDREKVKGVLNKVVSKEIAEEILKGQVHLGGELKEISILFADIRNFTGLTEKMDPQHVIALLNTCMTKISHLVDEFGGVIDKYVGDEAMALFGAPVKHAESALRAVCSGIEMQNVLNEWNKERKANNEAEVQMGIGIHTGEVVAGNMGAENRLNYTVLGSNVNLSSRLCSVAKPGKVLITESTLNAPKVRDSIDVIPLDAIELKGFTEKIPVYEVKGYKGSKPEFQN